MGAAAAKAVGELTSVPLRQSELRLADAEQFMLRWRPSTVAGTGIWDAEGICVNRDLLSALDDIVLLKEIQAFPMASPARSRLDIALGVAMSRLMEEFLLLRVWDASGLQGLTSLLFEKQQFSDSARASLAFPKDGSNTTEELSLCSSEELYASGGSRSSSRATIRIKEATLSDLPDMVTRFVDGTFLDELALIRRESLPVLHEISLRVIRAGYTGELLRTFNMAPCHVLDRFLSILQLRVERCCLETEQISFEDAEWWTMEGMIKRWILVSKLVGKALVVMQRQLQAQIFGVFDRFKNDYFFAIAKLSILVLLKFADGFTSVRSPEKLIYVLEMYEALGNAAPDILTAFVGSEHTELISRHVADVLAKLARALRIAIGGLITKIRSDCSQGDSATLSAGVHPLTRRVMACFELLAPHRTALDLILANGGEGAHDGGAASVTTFVGLVAELIKSLERSLEEKSVLICADAGGSAHLFLANNISFVLNRAADVDVLFLLGDDWAARRRCEMERHAASYVKAFWGPAVACLETGKTAKALAKFNAAFKEAHDSQVCGEVPDPTLRAALRKTVSGMVVPAYSAFVQKHPKLEKSVSYSADDLTEWLSELFEGLDDVVF